MCSDYWARIELVGIEQIFAELGVTLHFPEGRPIWSRATTSASSIAALKIEQIA